MIGSCFSFIFFLHRGFSRGGLSAEVCTEGGGATGLLQIKPSGSGDESVALCNKILSHFVTPVPVQPCLGDRMQDFSVHAGNKYLPKVKNPFGLNRPGD